jgi:hypothetical protein
MRFFAALMMVAWFALPISAAFADKDLFVPIAGIGRQADGRRFATALWVTNTGTSPARVTLDFLRAAQTNPAPRSIAFDLAAGATRVFDPLAPDFLGADNVTGALHIRADEPLLATSRAYSHLETEPMSRAVASSFDAIPARVAIGNGQSAIAHGVAIGPGAQERYKLYVVETVGQPLAYSVALVDPNGATLAQKGFYAAPHEARGFDLGDEFPNVRSDHAVARLRGMNGNGRIIFAGAQIARESLDGNAYEMSYSSEPRMRMPLAEVVAYAAVACAIIVAALVYRR